MYSSGRHSNALPRAKNALGMFSEFDMQLTFHNEEHLIARGVHVPTVLAFEHRHPHAASIEVYKHLVSVRRINFPLQSLDVNSVHRPEPSFF